MRRKRKNELSDTVLDGLVRQYIRLISGGFCKRCKKHVGVENIEVAHLYKRARKTVRWDLRNVYPLCKCEPHTGKVGCHYTIDNSHIEKASFEHEVMTPQEIEELDHIASLTLKDYPIDREQIKQDLLEKIRLLEG